jgi:uncharacterized OB-fold protein
MKICWDNLEKIRYKNGYWYNGYNVKYIYNDSCKNCGEPFLGQKNNKFCDNSCSKMGENHGNYKDNITKKNIPFYDTYAPQISYCEKIRNNKNILEIKCAYCGKWYIPTMREICNRIQALNNKSGTEARLYCSTQCKQECPIYNRKKFPKGFKPVTSREVQPELRQMCFERDNYTCQKCGKHQDELDVGLHCHHIEGIRWEPLESADLDKVITFCKICHEEVHKLPGCGYNDFKCS